MLLPWFFPKLSRGLKLVVIGVIIWLIGTAPLLVYLVLVRISGNAAVGPGVVGAFGFAANIAALLLVAAGILLWLREPKPTDPSTTK